MSKSVGNVIDPFSLADHYGVDQMRYFLLREVPFGQDGNYSHEAIVNRINADLANDLGNLAQRSLSMIAKNCDGTIPDPGEFSDEDNEILNSTDNLLPVLREFIDRQAIHRALEAIWTMVSETNRYFAGEAPWSLKNSDPRRMGTILYVTAETVRQFGILISPYMPGSAAKMLDLLEISESQRGFNYLGKEGRLKAGGKIRTPSPVFPRYLETESN